MCEQLFPERHIKHIAETNCKHRTPIFPTESRALYEAFVQKEMNLDQRFVTPIVFCGKMFGDTGYARVLEVIYNRWEVSPLFSSFVVNQKIYDPASNCARLYFVGCSRLRVAYIGTCVNEILKRMSTHMMKVSDLLDESDAMICVLGYLKDGS